MQEDQRIGYIVKIKVGEEKKEAYPEIVRLESVHY